jgi:hypothetical protein
MNAAMRNYPAGDLRVSDADRDRALEELSEAFQVGRITADEFKQRSEQARVARTPTTANSPGKSWRAWACTSRFHQPRHLRASTG